MADAWHDSELLRSVFERTEVLRKPLTGIITGYHVLPYVLVAPEQGHASRSVEVRGRIRVSPRLVLGLGTQAGPTYGEVFGESELMDRTVVARVFSFRYAPRLMLESEDLQIRRHDRETHQYLERVLDDLAQREIVDTGVILSPTPASTPSRSTGSSARSSTRSSGSNPPRPPRGRRRGAGRQSPAVCPRRIPPGA